MNILKKTAKIIAASAIAFTCSATAQVATEESPWSYKFELGLTGQSGNSQTLDSNIKFDALRKFDKNTFKYGFAYYLETSQGDKTANQFRAVTSYDVPVNEKWSWFIDGRYDLDEFKAWDHRISSNTGMAYRFDLGKHENKMDLLGKIGLGGRKEIDGNADRLITEAAFGLDYKWDISKTQKITASTTIYPDISDEIGQSRIVSEASWLIKLDTVKGLSLKFGIENEYESTTLGNAKHNDFKGIIALVYEF